VCTDPAVLAPPPAKAKVARGLLTAHTLSVSVVFVATVLFSTIGTVRMPRNLLELALIA
jgi:hypothetical protein